VAQHLAPAIILAMGAGIAFWIDRAPNAGEWRIRLHFAAGALLGLGGILLACDCLWPYKTKADLQTRDSICAMLATGMPDEPILVLRAERPFPPNFRWYLHEQSQRVIYDVSPTAAALAGYRGVWIVNYDDAQPQVLQTLAGQTGMKADHWQLQHLQIGPRELPPARLEIIHLRK